MTHGFGNLFASPAVRNQDGRRIHPVGRFQEPRAQPRRHLIHRTVHLVRPAGRDQHRGSLKRPRRFLVDIAAMRTSRLEFFDLLAAAAAGHQATTRGALGFSFAVPDSSPTLSSTIWINPKAALDSSLSSRKTSPNPRTIGSGAGGIDRSLPAAISSRQFE